MIDHHHHEFSVRKQCEIFGLNRSSVYYKPLLESPFNLEMMRMIDEQFLIDPSYGSRRMTQHLNKDMNCLVNRKKVQRLMRMMGLEAIYPKPRVSVCDQNHKKYPYLLKQLSIVKPNQVWGTDITYIPMQEGFLYLAAIVDFYSRFVITWDIFDTLEAAPYISLLKKALQTASPEIHNSDKGIQYTCEEYTNTLRQSNIKISMTGKGRCLDNILVERLWRSVKYEDVYLKNYRTGLELTNGLYDYFERYNNKRRHQSLNYEVPASIYYRKTA